MKTPAKHYLGTVASILLFSVLSLSLPIAAQNKITGNVIAADNESIAYQIKVEYADSTQTITTAFYKPAFDIEVSTIGNAQLTITANGYDSYHTQKTLQPGITDLGEITLFKKNIQLEEVVISAPKISIKQDGMDCTIRNIQNTYLGNAGNLIDMLKWTPGIMVQGNNAIAVAGKGAPIIYIDGRKVANNSELLALQSSDVSRIEIIREPDARYKNGTDAVIRIYMKKQLKDFVGVNITNTASMNRLFRNRTALDINWKSGIVSGNSSFSYSHDNGKDYETSGTSIYSNDVLAFSSLSDEKARSKRKNYTAFTGINFALNNQSNLRMQYAGDFQNEHLESHTTQWNTDLERETTQVKQISSIKPYDNRIHSASISYQLERNENSELNLIADYAKANRKYDQWLQESKPSDNRIHQTATNNRNNYDTYTFSGDYSFMIGKNDYENIGVNTGIFNSSSATTINGIPQNTDMENRYFNVYATYRKQWGRINAALGLRYEYDYTNNVQTEKGNKQNVKKEYSNLFPDVRITYSMKNRNKLTLKYSRTILRPDFYELNPTVYYEDSLHYYVGNPSLHPSFTDSYSLSLNVKKLTFNLIYRHKKDEIRSSYIQDAAKPFVTIETPDNSGKSDVWELNAIYNHFTKNLRLYCMGQLYYSEASFPYLAENKTESKLNAMLYCTASYTLKSSWNIFANGWYTSPKLMGSKYVGYSLCLNLGVSTSFFKKKLNASLSVNDIFNRMVTPTYMMTHSNNTDYWRRNKYDSRGVSLTLRYTFNSIKTKFEKANGNDDIISRAANKSH